MNPADWAAVDRLIRDVGSRIVLPRFRNLGADDVREKAPGDLVTVVDVEAETALTEGLIAIAPGSAVVGEEAVSKDPDALSRLTSTGLVWLVDPIDGTVNFVEGIAKFAVMVALVDAGRIVAGWIYDPVAGWMAHAEHGKGAWRDERSLSVASAVDQPSAPRRGNRQLMRRVDKGGHLPGVETFSFRCAGQEYVALASGEADYGLYTRLMPWDHAAGMLLHREAGGIGKLIDGTPYDVQMIRGKLLLTPDSASWERLSTALRA